MFGSVNYFTNSFKICIMNNFNLDESCSIDEKWTLLKAEIQEVTEGQPEKEIYMQNLERAYFEVKVELLGWEDEKDGN